MEKPSPGASEAPKTPDKTSASDSSLDLSITPPLSDASRRSPADDTSTISEHLSSIENDRSVQEIEVSNAAAHFSLMLRDLPSDQEPISQEPKPPSLNTSTVTNESLNSPEKSIDREPGTNGLEKSTGGPADSARSILDEILGNDQFKSDTESREESLDIFANVNLDDKTLNSYNLGKSADFDLAVEPKNDSLRGYDDVTKRVKEFEELIAVKDSTIAALTSELDSFREMMSNPSSNSLGTSTTEYKQYQEECHNKLTEYHNAIVHKDDLIQKLTESLHQSILNREELKQQGDHFKNEIAQLQTQLEETSAMLKNHRCNNKTEPLVTGFESECSKLEDTLNPSQLMLLNDVKIALNSHVQLKIAEKKKSYENEINNLRTKIEADKEEHDNEIARLRQLLAGVKEGSTELIGIRHELDAKHSQEMEELRTYFEKKCADLEKNYSEEVFSQHSRKMSGSSSCSEAELSSDLIFGQPGPGGDTRAPDYTRKDVAKLRSDLTEITALLDRYNLNNITDEDFEAMKIEIKKLDFRNLLRYDLAVIRTELQNKYHAELEILREDFDNRVDELNVEHKKKLRCVEEKYIEEIEDLNAQLRAGSGQLATVPVQEVRIVANDDVDEEWPEDLLVLKRRFSEKYEAEMAALRIEHQAETARLKEDHLKNLTSALERARRRSLRDADSLSKGELELLRERDLLKKKTSALSRMLGELMKYMTQCEDKLNDTLVEVLVGQDLEDEQDSGSANSSVRRIHLAPNFDSFINLIDDSSELDMADLEEELRGHLQTLSTDADAILAASTVSRNPNGVQVEDVKVPSRSKCLENKVTSLTRQLIDETQIKNELAEQLKESKILVQSLESERVDLENHLEQVLEKQKVVEADLSKARDKIAELIENGHKEVVSEGYGEDGRKGVRGMDDAVAALAELQDKARGFTENPSKMDPGLLLHLVEELARVGEKIVEEARRDRDDLAQQIDAADKRYKVTCQFLEEQAAEREQERDEAQKEIDCLREQLRNRDKDRASCERITTEVEHLEQQLREMTRLVEETETRYREVESERKEAVDKIFVLRDIIRELEQQVEFKTRSEEELKIIVGELECIVKHQQAKDGDEARRGGGDLSGDVHELHQQIGSLEGEVQRLRLSTEIAGSEGAIKQIRNHLCEFETTLDKRTKDLETLHSTISTTSCSSPSEDMSIRDVVNPVQTSNSSVFEECEVPLQQLARLKEKLVRHSRAEDAALKRIRDLEMQVFGLKGDLEEGQNERDILKKQISDQLVLISSLQIRLDEQRIRAEHIEKQTNTSLECRIYDLQNSIAALEEKLAKRDKTIAQFKTALEETKKRLQDRDQELANVKTDEIVARMQEQVEFLRLENEKLTSQLNSEAKVLPNLVENIITDKNNDIETLKEKLAETEKQLELYASLNLDRNQIDALKKLKVAGVSFTDLDFDEPEQVRKMEESHNDTLSASHEVLPHKRVVNETVFLGVEPEISKIEKVGPPNLFYSLQAPGGKVNSTEKHVRFEDEVEGAKLKEELDQKNEMIREYESRLKKLNDLEVKVGQLQASLEETERLLQETEDDLQKKVKDQESEIAAKGLEAKEKVAQLTVAQEELALLKNRVQTLTEDLEGRDGEIDELKNHQTQLQKELQQLKARLGDKEKEVETLEAEWQTQKDLVDDRDCDLKALNDEAKKHRETITALEEDVANLRQVHASELKLETSKLEKRAKAKDVEIAELRTKTARLDKEAAQLRLVHAEKDRVIAQMTEDTRQLHVNLETIQAKMQETGNVVDLARRVREEQKKNLDLLEEVHGLKAQLLSVDRRSLEEIMGQAKRELEYSAYLDSSISNAVSDHSSLEIQDVEALQEALKKQRATNRELAKAKEKTQKKLADLEGRHEELRANAAKLEAELDKERANLDRVQLEDGKLIEQMRIKLDGALDNEMELEKLLEMEKRSRLEIETQLAQLKAPPVSSDSKSESTQYKQLQSAELKKLSKELGLLKQKNEDLVGELRAIFSAKSELEGDLKYTQDLVELKTKEVRKLEGKVEEQAKNEQELRGKLRALSEKFEEKAREVENSRTLIEEMDHDRAMMKQQMDQLNLKLREAQARRDHAVDEDRAGEKYLPEKLMEKIKELSSAVKDNIQMVDFISRLTNEKAVLEQRIMALEQQNFANLPFDDPASRANYLFAKYLRAESYRKALIWQKRYLTSLLATYQTGDLDQTVVPELVARTSPPRSAGKERFRRVGFALVALNRMGFLVKRWHSGKRIVQQRGASPMARFQLGQPVSSQNFVNVPPAVPRFGVVVAPSALPDEQQTHHVTLPWCGNSPPSKDVHGRSKIRSSPYPLTSPGLLSKYVERFNEIQERLGMTAGPTQ